MWSAMRDSSQRATRIAAQRGVALRPIISSTARAKPTLLQSGDR
jgi:hypothetical protein